MIPSCVGLSLRRLAECEDNEFNLIVFERGTITIGLYSQTSWANNEDMLFKTGVKHNTTYYRNGVNSNPTMTAQSYQTDVFSPPQH